MDIVFWVEDMPPTIGGIQKRICDFTSYLHTVFPQKVLIIQKRGYAHHSHVKAVTLNDGSDYLAESDDQFDKMFAKKGSKSKLLYVSKPVSSDVGRHVKIILKQRQNFEHIVLRVASTRSARQIAKYSELLNDHGVVLHCLNEYSKRLLQKAGAHQIQLFHNSANLIKPVGINADGPIIYAGRFAPSKNLVELLMAWKLVQRNHSGKQLWLWGALDSAYAIQIKNIADNCPGVIYQGSYPVGDYSALTPASIIILPSFREGASNLVVEALALGKFVVGSDIPGIAEYLPNKCSQLIEKPFHRVNISCALVNAIRLINGCNVDLISENIANWYNQTLRIDEELQCLLEMCRV